MNKTTDVLPKFQTDYMFIGREQNSAMHEFFGNAQWNGDQLHVRPDRLL